MKLETVLPFVAAATAFVLPNVQVFEKLAVQHDQHDEHDDSPWWDGLPSDDMVVAHPIEDDFDSLSAGVGDAIHAFSDAVDDELDLFSRPRRGHGRHPPHTSNLTIYQLITASNHTKKFAKLVDEFEDIVQLLNSTKANHTLFVPVDKAFEHVPHNEKKKPSREFVEALVNYHIGLGLYPVPRILATQTVPTALTERLLGYEPQRIRTSVGLGGVHLNFYSRVIFPNIFAKNGVIHAVNHLLIPPPVAGLVLGYVPTSFSTLLYAYDKTGFIKYIHSLKMNGSTIFAPTNVAFARLGPVANAFLFNTEKGLGYLRALLKYQIVANTTLYTNAVYREGSGDVDFAGRFHADLPTLLEGKKVAVDVVRWRGFARMSVNGHVPVGVRDVISKNSAIQVVAKVPIPPHKHGKGLEDDDDDGDENIDVEELKGRLEDYLDEDSVDWMSGEL